MRFLLAVFAFNVAVVVVTACAIARAYGQTTFVYPNPNGFTALTPGQPTIFGYTRPDGGMPLIAPGHGTTFVNPMPGVTGGYSIIRPVTPPPLLSTR